MKKSLFLLLLLLPVAMLKAGVIPAFTNDVATDQWLSNQSPSCLRIAPVLQPFVDNHVLAGAVVLVANKEHVLALESVGYADVVAKKPMRTDAIFWIASMSKPIAAAALMVLVDEGKVQVEDPVEKYLPEFKALMVKNKKDKKAI